MNVGGNRLLAIASLLAVLTAVAFAQGPRGTSSATFGGKKVEIKYGRPSLAGRDMLVRVRPSMVWRLGMDQATSLTTEADLAFGEVTVPNGSYSLFAKKVSDTTWHLVVNKQTGQWGTRHDAFWHGDFTERQIRLCASPPDGLLAHPSSLSDLSQRLNRTGKS